MPLSKLTPAQLELRSKTKWHLDTSIPSKFKKETLTSYLQHLIVSVPTPGVCTTLTLHDRDAVPKKYRINEVSYNGLRTEQLSVPALVVLCPSTKSADIHLAIRNRDLASSLGSLAHEYWHIVQTFVQNIDISKGDFSVIEGEANREAGMRTREFRETYCLIDPRK